MRSLILSVCVLAGALIVADLTAGSAEAGCLGRGGRRSCSTASCGQVVYCAPVSCAPVVYCAPAPVACAPAPVVAAPAPVACAPVACAPVRYSAPVCYTPAPCAPVYTAACGSSCKPSRHSHRQSRCR